ncbi:hypothetical protein CR51_25085 [Caballeronia megalochromosomata]|nr:hypothetical protein CR51_25085 [Caballeronia megalochromosomata]
MVMHLWAPFQRSTPQKKGHARMVDDLRLKVDRFAILSIKTYAGIPPPKHEQRHVRMPFLPTID